MEFRLVFSEGTFDTARFRAVKIGARKSGFLLTSPQHLGAVNGLRQVAAEAVAKVKRLGLQAQCALCISDAHMSTLSLRPRQQTDTLVPIHPIVARRRRFAESLDKRPRALACYDRRPHELAETGHVTW